jgi:hypothetical protein
MSRYHLSDPPRYVPPAGYESAVAEMVERLRQQKGIIAVYSIGGFSAPGISDVDLVAVFEDDCAVSVDYRKQQSSDSGYLFIHSLYGASRSFFLEAQIHSFFRPYRLLAGTDLLAGLPEPVASAQIRQQTAFEYLIRLYISLSLQRSYRLLRIRSVLLNANGVGTDIQFLCPGDTQAVAYLETLNRLRKGWFENNHPPVASFIEWFERFHDWLGPFLEKQLKERHFYLPEQRAYALGKNLLFTPGTCLSAPNAAIRLPFLAPLFGRRYFNVLNRINRMRFTVPFHSESISPEIIRHFEFTNRHRDYNRAYLPAYLPLTSSLHLR